MTRLMQLLLVALVLSSNTQFLLGDEGGAETLLGSKPIVEEGTGVGRLKQEKYNTALRELQSRHALWRGGKISLVDLISAADRLRRSELDTSKKRLLPHFRFAQELESNVDAQVKNGVGNAADLALAQYHRIDLEILLLEE